MKQSKTPISYVYVNNTNTPLYSPNNHFDTNKQYLTLSTYVLNNNYYTIRNSLIFRICLDDLHFIKYISNSEENIVLNKSIKNLKFIILEFEY